MLKVIKISDVEAQYYLAAGQVMVKMFGIDERLALPYTVMVKGYGDDWENFSELNLEDLDDDNVVDAGYEDYQLWLNDTLSNKFAEETK